MTLRSSLAKVAAATGGDPIETIDLCCDPALPPARQAEARARLLAMFGPYGELVAHACAQAAVARRDAAAVRDKLERLLGGVQLRGIVTAVDERRVRVLIAGVERVLNRPDGFAVGVGQVVMTDVEGQAVVAAGEFLVGGQTYAFRERLDGRYVLVRPLRDAPQDETGQLAIVADSIEPGQLRPGDRLLGWSLDGGNVVLITRHLGALRPQVEGDVGVSRSVSRDDIVGLDGPYEETELLFLDDAPGFEALWAQIDGGTRGVVFSGVPGCGKTLLACRFLDEVRGRGGLALYRTASFYLSKWVGDGAARLRADFAALDAAFAESRVRPLLVIDELEAIALDRLHAGALSPGHLDVLNELLSLTTRTEARVIGISNVANRVLDSALTRSGRLRIVEFPATLAREQTATLVAKRLAGVPLERSSAGVASAGAEAVAREFGEAVSDMVFAPSGPLAELLHVQLADGRVLVFGAADLATAAAVADGIVRPLLARRLRRDVRSGRASPAPLTLDELRAATAAYFEERAATITRDNVRSVLRERIPDDQAVTAVTRGQTGG
jgi:hypothetical protein